MLWHRQKCKPHCNRGEQDSKELVLVQIIKVYLLILPWRAVIAVFDTSCFVFFFSGWYTRFCQAISCNLCFLGYCLSLRFNLPHSSLLLGSYKSQLSRAQFCIEKLLDYSRCSSINSGYYILDTFKTFPVRIPFCSK